MLLEMMRSSPQVLQFVPHFAQHAEELGPLLEVLADHVDDLGARASWLLEREERLAQVLRACAEGDSAAVALKGAGWTES
jgi:hypothetical protein